ncbi:zinc finger protein 652-B-like [Watersipora subatra]|uniref:zinc finger protein 652-B-like n=1 Tax=Watersipora subatra TaxID=2589382 RepID=UPI00355C7D2D
MAEHGGLPSQLMVDDSGTTSQSRSSSAASGKHATRAKPKKVLLQPANCVVIINGQKCQLKINPDTGVLMAYPVKGNATRVEERKRKPETICQSPDSSEERLSQVLNEKPANDVVTNVTKAPASIVAVTEPSPENINTTENPSISIFQDDNVHELQPDDVADFIIQEENVDVKAEATQQTSLVNSSDLSLPSDDTIILPGDDKEKLKGKLPKLIIPSVGGVLTSMAINEEQVMGVTKITSSIISSGNSDKEAIIEDVFCPELTITTNMKPLLKQFLISPGTSGGEGSAIGIKTSGQDLKKLLCTDCNFQAYYPQQFDNHLKERHSSQLHKCKCCGYVTLDEGELTKHYADLHPRNICELCNFVSEHGYVIKRHMYRHSAEGCTCEICGKTYKDQYILKMHVKMVHSPAEVLYQCEFCSKRFTRKAHLKRHARTHNTNKAFGCPHCDYRGCERSDVTKHMLVHEAPKLVCEVCGKTFRHQKNKDLHMKRHNGQRDFKCGVCEFFGYTFTDIRKHIERRHSEWKNTLCEKCGTRFKSNASLQAHIKCWHDNPQGSTAASSTNPDVIVFVDQDAEESDQSNANTLIINADGTLMPSEQEEQVVAAGEDGVVEYNGITVGDLEQEHVTITNVTESLHEQSQNTAECVTEIVDLPMNM